MDGDRSVRHRAAFDHRETCTDRFC